MTKPTHGYLTEPEWFSRNAPAERSEDWMVWVSVALIVAFAGWMIFGTGV